MHRAKPIRLTFCALCFLVNVGTIVDAQDANSKIQPKQDKWKQTSPMPKVVVARIGSDNNSVDILEPVCEIVDEVVTYTVQIPFVQEDGKTANRTETRQRTVKISVTKTEKRNIKIDRLLAYDIDGKSLPVSELPVRLKAPIHVLFGNKPDEYAKSVLRDDLTVTVENVPGTPSTAPVSTATLDKP